jgi:DNA invertase Pin-like site-specific DNA recombinase
MKHSQSLVPVPATRCATYVRVSTTGQEDGSSLATQEAACCAYAAEHGYDVTQVFREVYSGAELWDRPQLSALREAIRRHEVDVVVAYAIDRLARDPVHLGVILSEAQHADVRVAFVSEPLDDSPEGQLIRFVRGYAAKIEHEKIRERSLRGKRARVLAGQVHGFGRELFGYRRVKAAGVREVFEPDPRSSAGSLRGPPRVCRSAVSRDGCSTTESQPRAPARASAGATASRQTGARQRCTASCTSPRTRARRSRGAAAAPARPSAASATAQSGFPCRRARRRRS